MKHCTCPKEQLQEKQFLWKSLKIFDNQIHKSAKSFGFLAKIFLQGCQNFIHVTSWILQGFQNCFSKRDHNWQRSVKNVNAIDKNDFKKLCRRAENFPPILNIGRINTIVSADTPRVGVEIFLSLFSENWDLMLSVDVKKSTGDRVALTLLERPASIVADPEDLCDNMLFLLQEKDWKTHFKMIKEDIFAKTDKGLESNRYFLSDHHAFFVIIQLHEKYNLNRSIFTCDDLGYTPPDTDLVITLNSQSLIAILDSQMELIYDWIF